MHDFSCNFLRHSCPPVSLFTAQVMNYCPDNFLPIQVRLICIIEHSDLSGANISDILLYWNIGILQLYSDIGFAY